MVLGVRLLLLLGTDVNGPPDRLVDFNVFVEDVRDFATRAGEHRCRRPRVSLYVDSLERVVELDVHELNVVDAGVFV